MTRDKFMLYADARAVSIKNFISKIRFSFKQKEKEILKRNRELIVDDGNKTCFILGNGPSLLNIDTQLLNTYTTFTVNDFYKGDFQIESTYHVMIDPFYLDEGVQYIEGLVNKYEKVKCILPIEAYNSDRFRSLKKKKDRIYYVNIDLKTYSDFISCDMSKEMTISVNVMPFAIQCAIYMGFKRIYLLGYEFTMTNTIYSHFYDVASNINEIATPSDCTEHLVRCALVQKHNWAIAQYCKRNGIIIKNLTEGSFITAYPMDSFDNIMKKLSK